MKPREKISKRGMKVWSGEKNVGQGWERLKRKRRGKVMLGKKGVKVWKTWRGGVSVREGGEVFGKEGNK